MVQSMFTNAYDEVVATVVAMRKRAKLTQRELADILGREQNLVGRIETGQRRVDLVEFIWICHACGADPEIEVAKLTKTLAGHVPRRRGPRRSSP